MEAPCERMPMLKVARRPPIWYRVAANLPFGSHRILDYFDRHNQLDYLANFPFYDRSMVVPLKLRPRDLSKYQRIRISAFAAACDKYLGEFDLVDCGAHIGLFSAQFGIFSPRVKKLLAVEANPALFKLLEANIAIIRAAEVECLNAAICDFEGRGRLIEPSGYPGLSDAMYIVKDPDGDIPVTTLAAVLGKRTAPKAAIKLDIEGAEVPALCGSADAVRALEGVVLFLEVHKGVLDRIGTSDVEMLAAIEDVRSFTWINSSDGKPIDRRYPILEQTQLANQCDLIGISV
jgi:FkbM family methyltransferase